MGAPGIVHAPTPLPPLPFVPFNVISQTAPSGGAVLFATPPVDFTHSTEGHTTRVFVDGKWRENKVFANAIDIAGDGTAIGSNNHGIVAPILIGKEWHSLSRTVPSAPASWLTNSQIQLNDITSQGWILARSNTNNKSAALLPIRVDGVNGPASPENLEDPAAGVDRISMAALSGTGYVPEIWIMAPVSKSNTVRFRAPLNAGQAYPELRIRESYVHTGPAELLGSADSNKR